MDGENEPLLTDLAKQKQHSNQRSDLRWYHYVGDFLNILKAFIGTNYQALPFAFSKSGIIPGVLGVFLIATLTDHCCQKLLRCKRLLVDELTAAAGLGPAESETLRQRLAKTIGYGDLGRYVYGAWCANLVQFSVWFTQYTTCITYLVFIGNAVFEIFPLTPALIPINNGTPAVNGVWPEAAQSAVSRRAGDGIPMLALCHLSDVADDVTAQPEPELIQVSTAPSLVYIILFPVAFFIATSMIRKLRWISPFSAIATFALTIGAGSVFIYLVVGFSMSDDWAYAKLFTMPLFIGQLISAYEGIGCLIPIESSMEGNRHIFPRFLHINVYLVFVVLCAFGLVGYLRFGSEVQQIIVLNIPQHGALSIFVDATLIASVLFTYPLQCFPVIEITEWLVLSRRTAPGKPRSSMEYDEIDEAPYSSHAVQWADDDGNASAPSGHGTDNLAVEIMQTVPSWKRNIVRLLISLSIAGFAILLRDNFAYLASFTGAVGCSLLAFILPCMIHLRLRASVLPTWAIVRDSLIICFSIVCSLLTLAVIFEQIATGQIKA